MGNTLSCTVSRGCYLTHHQSKCALHTWAPWCRPPVIFSGAPASKPMDCGQTFSSTLISLQLTYLVSTRFCSLASSLAPMRAEIYQQIYIITKALKFFWQPIILWPWSSLSALPFHSVCVLSWMELALLGTQYIGVSNSQWIICCHNHSFMHPP